MMQLEVAQCGGYGNGNESQPQDILSGEAQLHMHDMRGHDQELFHTPINIPAHKCFGGRRVVPAMVIESGQ